MPKATIIYASWTGNSEEIAEYLAESFQKLNVEVRLSECQQIDAKDFLDADICVVSTYTFGSRGDLPDEIVGFYFDLEKIDLTGKVFGATGSGEEFYGYFCKSVDDFDKQFEKTGAVRGAEPLKIELNPSEEDEKRLDEFAKSLLDTWEKLKM
ncbi:MAG: flavodoxin [Moheibacter sp.]